MMLMLFLKQARGQWRN